MGLRKVLNLKIIQLYFVVVKARLTSFPAFYMLCGTVSSPPVAVCSSDLAMQPLYIEVFAQLDWDKCQPHLGVKTRMTGENQLIQY